MKQIKSPMSVALVGILIAGLLPFSAQAHRQWIAPSAAQVEGKAPYITVDAAVSESLFEMDSFPLKLDGLVITAPDGSHITPENSYTGKLRSAFDLQLTQQGTYRMAVVTELVMASYKLNGEEKRYRGTPDGLAKDVPANAENLQVSRTFGRVESFATNGKPNDTALQPVGKGLEMQPLTHPSDYVAGEPARFRMLLDGKPVASLNVTIVPGSVKYRDALQETAATTDANGEFSVTWPIAERYWIGASYPPRAEGPPPAPGQPRPMVPVRYSYSATVQVLPN
ncbi:hypothetical protein MMA231_04055 (plasmid) [Asticcacaulis sp. MM231]|uniref:DUF4198 domain-containing protein n=1 Tax=Asticcacaulis sp. MM231 TaxID=3157666 RepID=UPI0032D59168